MKKKLLSILLAALAMAGCVAVALSFDVSFAALAMMSVVPIVMASAAMSQRPWHPFGITKIRSWCTKGFGQLGIVSLLRMCWQAFIISKIRRFLQEKQKITSWVIRQWWVNTFRQEYRLHTLKC